MIKALIHGIGSIFTSPEEATYLVLSVATPITSEEVLPKMLPNIDGLPWYATFAIAIGWMLIAVYRIRVKNDKEKRTLEQKIRELESTNAALEKLVDRLEEKVD